MRLELTDTNVKPTFLVCVSIVSLFTLSNTCSLVIYIQNAYTNYMHTKVQTSSVLMRSGEYTYRDLYRKKFQHNAILPYNTNNIYIEASIMY